MKKELFLLSAILFLLFSCKTPEVAYLQDMQDGRSTQVLHEMKIRVQPEDKLSIVVNSRDELLVKLFNLPGTTGATATSQGPKSIGYAVGADGTIDFPVLGAVKVAGLTREEVAATIKQQLISQNLVKDPVVVVNFLNLSVSVLGEVSSPGRYEIDKDRMTIFDAIAMAGDLTVHGQRDKVFVQREEGNKRVLYQVDLRSGSNVYASPVYYLQQNDIVYVEPNKVKARSGDLNANTLRTPAFWMSLASFIASFVVLLTN